MRKPYSRDRERGSSAQRGYDARWRRLRNDHLEREPLCRFCRKRGRRVPATVVDHIQPHGGDEALLLDPANLQSLCKPCHDGAKQAEDKGQVVRGCDVHGNPIDASHHWGAPEPGGRGGSNPSSLIGSTTRLASDAHDGS